MGVLRICMVMWRSWVSLRAAIKGVNRCGAEGDVQKQLQEQDPSPKAIPSSLWTGNSALNAASKLANPIKAPLYAATSFCMLQPITCQLMLNVMYLHVCVYLARTADESIRKRGTLFMRNLGRPKAAQRSFYVWKSEHTHNGSNTRVNVLHYKDREADDPCSILPKGFVRMLILNRHRSSEWPRK